jgi:hypothetical protein
MDVPEVACLILKKQKQITSLLFSRFFVAERK